MMKKLGISLTDNQKKTDQTKEQEAAPTTDKEKKEQQDDKKVLRTHVLMAFKKPRSQSLIPVYVRVN